MKSYGAVLLTLLHSAFLMAQSGMNIEYLGNWNSRSTPSGVYSPYSACWGYTAPDGREYALIGSNLGTSIIDITDTLTLTEVTFIPGPTSNWREMKTYDHYAYIVSDQGDSAQGNGVQIVDLSNLPGQASLVSTYVWQDIVNQIPVPIPRTHTVSVEGKYLYLNGGGSYTGIRILDLSDPVQPTQVGRYIGPYVHDSYIRNDTIFAAAIYGVGIDIIDARDKANPVRIKLQGYPGAGTHNTWTTTDGKYLLTTDEIGSTPKTLKVWDIHDVTNPFFVTQIASVNGTDTAIVHNVVVKGNYAYVAWYTAGVKVIDVTNPPTPQVAGFYDTFPANDSAFYKGVWGVYPFFPSGKFVVSDMQTGLHVMRYTPTPVGVKEPARPGGYALNQNFPNPFNPVTTITFSLPREEFVTITVFDMLGKEVIRPLEEYRGPGEYRVILNAMTLSSGIYIYRLTAGTFVGTRSMIVLK